MLAVVAMALWPSLVARAAEVIGPETPSPGLRHYYPLASTHAAETIDVDVCVYGGTPAGVMAAVQASRMGKSAVLAVFRRHVGGMTSGGLTGVDLGKAASIGGLAEEFLNRMPRWTGFQPSEAESGFRGMLREAGVPVLYEYRLEQVEKAGTRILALTFENGARITGKVFIDATYEGDVLARAGVSYAMGRESNASYGETLNGFQLAKTHQFEFPIDPFRTPGEPASGLLPGLTGGTLPHTGTGDKRVQAYNFRMHLVDAAGSRPFPKPPRYNRDDYALLIRYWSSAPKGFEWFIKQRGPFKLQVGDCNNAGPVSTDFVGGSDDWPEAGYEERERIFQRHVTWQQGLMWLIANDSAVPAEVQAAVRRYGLPRNEFPETDGWPHELYVREGRRMISDLVMTEHHCSGRDVATDSVGLASYTMDSHHTARVVVDGAPRAEGCVERPVPGPYPIGYRALVPKPNECTNLLVSVALSSTHIAYGSIRMEPVFMILGQSAGTAAAVAIDEGVPVQQVRYSTLRVRLLQDRQKLDWE